RVGIESFDCTPDLEAAFQDAAAGSAALHGAVDGIAASGGTAIGRALSSSTLLFGAEAAAVNKTAFLISDGHNTCGEDPADVVSDLSEDGIRVFSLATGEASNDGVLSAIGADTNGAGMALVDPTALARSLPRL